MHTVFLGLGSNIGDRSKNIEKAIQLLKANSVDIQESSTIIETRPVGGPPQGNFLNSVIKCHVNCDPHELLKTLKTIEKEMGRKETVRNGPRIIDIDILLFDKIRLTTEHLTIPHPRMKSRDFVMRPLKEIEPDVEDNYFK